MGRWVKESDSAALTVHRQVNRHLEVGSKITASTETLESTVAVAARMALGHDVFLQGPALTLTANANSDMKVGLSLQHQSVTPASGTQMLSVISVTADHRAREHTVGAMLQFFY